MNKWTLGIAAVMLAAIPALAQMAQGGHEGHEGHGPGMKMMMKGPQTRVEVEAEVKTRFAELDTNKDGAISQDEAQAYRAKRTAEMADKMFSAIDTNHDGQISRAEFDAHHAGMKGEGKGGHGMGMGGHRDGMEMFERADANADGKLTLAEASAKVLDMFDKADANKDGTVTPEERRAAMMAWMDSHRDHVHGDPHVDEKK